jgi:hypothetical protein
MLGEHGFQAIPGDAAKRIVAAIANGFKSPSHSAPHGVAFDQPSTGNASSEKVNLIQFQTRRPPPA